MSAKTIISLDIAISDANLALVDALAHQFDCGRGQVLAHVLGYGLQHYVTRHGLVRSIPGLAGARAEIGSL